MAHSRDLEGRQAPLGEQRSDHVGDQPAVWQVDLVESDETGPIGKAAIGGQLGLDDIKVGKGLAVSLERGGIDHVHDHRAPLDVAQELQAEASPLAGTRDEAGHVRDRVGDITGRHDTEVGHESGEGIVSDLGARLG